MMLWLETFAHDVRERIEEEGFVVLGLDCHGAQMMHAFQARAKELKIVLVYGPPNCTDVTAPVDAGIGATLKQLSNQLYQADYDKNHAEYEANGISAKVRRMNPVTWAVAAWQLMCQDYLHLMRRSFVKTGWYPLNPDKSEDHWIECGNVSNYEWRTASQQWL